MRVRLNKRIIDQTPYQGPGSCYLWDTELPCFGIRIYPTGRKSFVVSYWAKGRRRFFTLGRYGELTLQQARILALETLAKAHKGDDPADERQAANHAPRMTDLAKRHLEEHSKVHKKGAGALKDKQIWGGRVLPRLGRRKVSDVERRDIQALMTEMAETPALANKVRMLLGKAMNLAEMWGWRPEGSNPCRHVKRYKEESRERYLSESELARLGQVLSFWEEALATCPYALNAIRLLILTGCRSSEILKLRWEDVDFERRCLHLPDSKTGKRMVVLNESALRILQSLKPLPDNQHVIPGRHPGSRRSTLHNIWQRVKVEAGIPDVRIHDLRHTFASFGVNAGHSLSIIGKLLGHSKIITTQRYAHVADDPVRKATEAIGATLAASLGERRHGNRW